MEDYFYVDSKIYHESEPLPKAENPNESVVINWVILGSDLINPLSHHVPKLMDISDRKGNETGNQDLSSHFSHIASHCSPMPLSSHTQWYFHFKIMENCSPYQNFRGPTIRIMI